MGGVYRAKDVLFFSCDQLELDDNTRVYMCWRGLCMGDHNAVDSAEEFHFNVLRSGGLMRDSHLLVYPGLMPRSPEAYWEGVMIDDQVGVQVYDLHLQ